MRPAMGVEIKLTDREFPGIAGIRRLPASLHRSARVDVTRLARPTERTTRSGQLDENAKGSGCGRQQVLAHPIGQKAIYRSYELADRTADRAADKLRFSPASATASSVSWVARATAART
jgi:hypothetical protein